MASYNQFTQNDRIMLSALLRKDLLQSEIARALGKSQSSISRELNRNGDTNGGYNAGLAKRKYIERKERVNQKLRRIKNDPWLQKYIQKHLKKYWSPEQIAGRVRKEYNAIVCHETIYKYIYEDMPAFKKYLRCRKGKYRRRYGTKKREKQREEEKKARIDARPEIIETRERIGDWEGDTIIGKKGSGSVMTSTERKSGYVAIDYVARATAEAIRKKTIRRFHNLPKNKRITMTYDNGTEFSEYELIGRDTGMKIYFAYPYHSWERGTNENTNGLIRQFFPKKSSFAEMRDDDTKRVMRLLNSRPRKRLGFLTPAEVFLKNMHLT